MKRTPLGPGKSALARGSTFATRTTGMKRTDWRATNPPWRREEKRLPGARGWTQRVFTLHGNRCVVCGSKAVQAHHAVPRGVILRAAHLPPDVRETLAYDARNGVPICVRCHERHELAVARIPFLALPTGVVEWAVFHGFEGRIMDERVYPRGGG